MATEPEEPTTQSLQSQYAAQFADHLAANREEQARLRKRLEQLETDEAWLVKALKTVSAPAEADAGAQAPEGEPAPPQDNTSEPTEAAEPSEATDVEASAAVPKQRQDKPAEAPAKKTTAKKTAAKKTTAKKATAKKPEAKKTAAKQAPAAKKTTAAKAGEPPLGELLLTVLGKHAGQPRTAGEVAGDLEREYPERARDINTVRNTLERLVAKSRIERTKQKNTVLYTAVTESAPAADDAAAEASPTTETAGAEETEKVPAQAW
ncbi:BlaI/MecI/CopY family transcriptional regulator [Streptomyces hirsutus]|uniref:BlaI/MecI/CopY family transcriptional regulator n=1 Tax=Streptomyces hirsutus TaxID=35620 RepID=UPI0006E1BF36|nr:BlaI/MecI/CopY family transcriptional regulator [Streptomyces hirsutus]